MVLLFELKVGEQFYIGGHHALPNVDGHEVKIHRGVMQIREEDGRLLARISRGHTRLYTLELSITQPLCLAAHTGDEAWRWHGRFGHTSFAALRRMGKEELVRGLPVLDQVEQLCESYLVDKQRRTPFPHQATRRATRSLGLLHGDLCGPISSPTPRGNKFFLLLVDDYSRYMWVSLIASKDQAASEIKRIQAAAEKKSGNLLSGLRTDRGGEFATS
jgi:hypothetical protein